MARFSFFGDQEHRVFNYKPIYYDQEKEERRQMFGKVDGSIEKENQERDAAIEATKAPALEAAKPTRKKSAKKEAAPEPAPQPAPAEPAEEAPVPDEPAPAEARPAAKPAAKKAAPKKAAAEAKAEEPKEEAAVQEPAPKAEKKSAAPKKASAPKAEPKPAAEVVPAEQLDPSTLAGKAQDFLNHVTKLMGVETQVHMATDEEGFLHADLQGDTSGILIGRRGETLDALQHLTSLYINKGKSDYTRITLDTENYRARREDTLIRLANRYANRAHSEGEEPNRHIVITPRKQGAREQQAE